MEFQKYIVGKLNSFNLDIKINNRDKDAAHPLKLNSRSGAVIIKFISRNIKHTIYKNKTKLKELGIPGLGITEALTKTRLSWSKLPKTSLEKSQ